MKLKDFMDSVLAEAGEQAYSMYGLSKIKKIANCIYKANCVSPAFTQVRFDSAIMQMEDSRATQFNILMKLTPEHPYFRPWLKSLPLRYTQPLYLLKFGKKAPELSPCEQLEETEISSITDTMEKHIITRVLQLEHCVHTLTRITDHYSLQSADISDLLNAMDCLVKDAKYDRSFYLDAENRKICLPNQ